jgi:hypothetical protein
MDTRILLEFGSPAVIESEPGRRPTRESVYRNLGGHP